MQGLPVLMHCHLTCGGPLPQPGTIERQNWVHSASTELGQSDAQTGGGENDNLQPGKPGGVANMQRHCGWRTEGVGGGPHPQLPSAIVVQICPCSGQKSSLQANRGFPGPPQWWSTHVQRPPSAPGANSQKGNSKGHGPPHIAVPALGSPLTTPQPNGVGVGVGAAAGSQAQLPSACIVHVCAWSGQKSPLQATPAVPHSWSTQVQRPPATKIHNRAARNWGFGTGRADRSRWRSIATSILAAPLRYGLCPRDAVWPRLCIRRCAFQGTIDAENALFACAAD